MGRLQAGSCEALISYSSSIRLHQFAATLFQHSSQAPLPAYALRTLPVCCSDLKASIAATIGTLSFLTPPLELQSKRIWELSSLLLKDDNRVGLELGA
jgi:hypothetical protein